MDEHLLPLGDARILVPPARPEINPLSAMLGRQGATTLHFPALEPRYPSSHDTMDRALRGRMEFTWIVFSGSHSVHRWLERAGELELDDPLPAATRIGAIGHGAIRALRTEGRPPEYAPGRHVASDVASALPGRPGDHVLLVRAEGGSDSLPRRLAGRGFQVSTADGYKMLVRAAPREARELTRRGLDVIALANPTAVRYLHQGTTQAGLGLQQLAGGALIAAVGEATARAARERGLEPRLVAAGQIADLTSAVVRWWETRPLERRDLGTQAEAFVSALAEATAGARAAMAADGRDLVRRLGAEVMDLGCSRATEFSPEIGRLERLAGRIEALVQGRDEEEEP